MSSNSNTGDLEREIKRLKAELKQSQQKQKELLNHKQQIDAIFDNAPAEIYLKDHEGRYLKINKQFEKIFGVRNEDLVGKFPDIAHDPELAASTRAQDLAVLNSGEIISREEQAKLVIDDRLHTLLTIKFPVFDTDGEINGLGAVVTDITDQKTAQAKFRTMFMSAPVGITLNEGETGKTLEVNPAYAKLVGRDIDDILRDGWDSFTHPDDLPMDLANLKRLNDGEIASCKISKRYIKPDGSIVWAETTMATIEGISEPSSRLFLAVIVDITERKQFEEKIWHQANHDFLTELPNRNMVQDRLTQLIKKHKRDGSEFAVLLLDLDQFKEVNDTLGHDVGDTLLVQASRRIQQCLRETDTVARLGGDEFVILLGELSSQTGVEKVAQNINQVLTESFVLGNDTTYVTASIGITLFPQDADNITSLIKNADQAMYEAKKQGRNQYHFFTQSMQDAAMQRKQLVSDLRVSLKSNQFQLLYQPIVELDSGAVYKAEVLLRWQHPSWGTLLPEAFLETAEDSQLISPIGEWVFKQASYQLQHWLSVIDEDFQISVNIESAQFSRAFDKICAKYLGELNLPAKAINIDAREALLLTTDEETSSGLQALRQSGIEISLDSFASGYSSLSHLHELDIDYLKIDRDLICELEDNNDSLDLCSSLINTAHEHGIKVIAKGIETAKQRDILIAIGCDYGQGFWYSPPILAYEFEKRYGHVSQNYSSQAV